MGPYRSNPPAPLPPVYSTVLYLMYFFQCFYITPYTLDGVGGYEMACGHCRRPRKKSKQTCHTTFINVAGIPRGFSSVPPENLATQLSSPLRESRGASRPFPRKTLSHNFHHRGCIPRGFSYVLVSVPQGPDDGSSQESFVLHRDQGTKQDSAPSWTQPPHFTLCLA